MFARVSLVKLINTILVPTILFFLPIGAADAVDPYFTPPPSRVIFEKECYTAKMRSAGRACYGGGQAYIVDVFVNPIDVCDTIKQIAICYKGNSGNTNKIDVTRNQREYRICDEPKDIWDCSPAANCTTWQEQVLLPKTYGCSPEEIADICAGRRAMPRGPYCGGTQKLPENYGDWCKLTFGGCKLATPQPMNDQCICRDPSGSYQGWVTRQ